MAYYRNVQVGKKDWSLHFNNARILIVTFFIETVHYQEAWWPGKHGHTALKE